jgi:hypothetical protein
VVYTSQATRAGLLMGIRLREAVMQCCYLSVTISNVWPDGGWCDGW